MKVAIVGGRSRADYLIGAFAESADTVVVINDDHAFCEYLSSRHEATVIWGNGMQRRVLEDAGIRGFDAIVALTGLDADNLAICQIAKRFLDIPLQLCIVSNPENTKIFRQLGITTAISATATLAQAIRDAMGTTLSKSCSPSISPMNDLEEFGDPPSSLSSVLSSWHRLGKG